jgi:hypothetical protein
MRDDLASLDLRCPMIHTHIISALVMLMMLMLAIPFGAFAQSLNLLANPDFEDEGRWLFQDGVRESEIAIPSGGWFARLRRGVPARRTTCLCLRTARAVLTLAVTGRVLSFVMSKHPSFQIVSIQARG